MSGNSFIRCAGICCYEGKGGLCSVRLSTPLLKLRPRKDLVETLLHEMIHAYLFVTDNNKDHDGHGPEFHKHMYRINAEAGTKISVYHNFHDEVEVYKTHWWKCNGPCQKRSPYFGMVKRSMNRAPSKNDIWWADHQKTCGGTYIKVKEPEGFGQKKQNGKNSEKDCKSDSEIDKKKSKPPDIRSFWEKGKSLQNNKAVATTSGAGDRFITDGILQKRTSSEITGSFLLDNKTQRTKEMGDNSSAAKSSSDHSNLNKSHPVSNEKTNESDLNVMNAKTIWNKDKEQEVSKPSFTEQGESGIPTTNIVNNYSKGTSSTDLNVMKARTIWNKDKEQAVNPPSFIGKGEILGRGNSELSWLAKLRKEMAESGRRETSLSVNRQQDSKSAAFCSTDSKQHPSSSLNGQEKREYKSVKGKVLLHSETELCNKSSLNKSKKKFKKALLCLSDSDDEMFEPETKRLRKSNSPDLVIPTQALSKSDHLSSVDKIVTASPRSKQSGSPQTSPGNLQRTINDFFSSPSKLSSSASIPVSSTENIPMASCPVCQIQVATVEINNHLDLCLASA